MFFTDREKQIYTPPGSAQQYDPLAVNHQLTIASENRLNNLIIDHNALHDVLELAEDDKKHGLTPQQDRIDEAAILTAKADLELAQVARKAFGLPAFPDCLDATALEYLFNFLDWMEKKSEMGVPPSPSPASSDSTAA